MPFRSSSITWLALIVVACGGLSACSSLSKMGDSVSDAWGKLWSGHKHEPVAIARTDAALAEAVAAPATEVADNPPELFTPVEPRENVLSYWETITGGFAGSGNRVRRTVDVVTGGDFIKLEQPTAIAVRGDYLYIVDVGLNEVLRYNRVSQRIERLIELSGLVTSDVADIYVTPDLRIYIADTYGSRVLGFDDRGKKKVEFKNKLNLVRPVAITEEESSGHILVADGEFDHVLSFTPQGELLSAAGGRGNEPGKFLSITTMVRSADTYYVGARVGQRIQALTANGDYLYSFPQDTVVFPTAMAADDEFRLFVGDYMDNTIKVYERGRFLTSMGGNGVGPGSFKRVTDLWVDNDLLYVVDSLNSRIQVLKIAPAAPLILEQ